MRTTGGGICKTWNERRASVANVIATQASSFPLSRERRRRRGRSLSTCVTGRIYVGYLLFLHECLCGCVSWTLNVSLSIAVRSGQPGILLYTTLWRTPRVRKGEEWSYERYRPLPITADQELLKRSSHGRSPVESRLGQANEHWLQFGECPSMICGQIVGHWPGQGHFALLRRFFSALNLYHMLRKDARDISNSKLKRYAYSLKIESHILK